ncbi:MAG: fatty acid desaturase family protein [Oceanococcus sp.]
MQQDLAALNKEAILAAKQYMGEMAWLTVAMMAVILAGFVVNLWLFSLGILPLWLALPIYAILTYMAYTPLHEAAHGNIHGKYASRKWLNDLCGYIAGQIMLVPYASHTVEHFTHHRYTNQPEKDPDFVVSGMRGGVLALVIYGLKFLWVQNTFLFREYWAGASLRERSVYALELILFVGWRVAFLWLCSRELDWALLLFGYLAGAFFTAYWFAYRPHLPYENSARYQNTNSLIMPTWMKPLEWFWLGQNLHSIHHLFPRVPFYRYHALHREIEPILRAHGTPIVGLFSRADVPIDQAN